MLSVIENQTIAKCDKPGCTARYVFTDEVKPEDFSRLVHYTEWSFYPETGVMHCFPLGDQCGCDCLDECKCDCEL